MERRLVWFNIHGKYLSALNAYPCVHGARGFWEDWWCAHGRLKAGRNLLTHLIDSKSFSPAGPSHVLREEWGLTGFQFVPHACCTRTCFAENTRINPSVGVPYVSVSVQIDEVQNRQVQTSVGEALFPYRGPCSTAYKLARVAQMGRSWTTSNCAGTALRLHEQLLPFRPWARRSVLPVNKPTAGRQDLVPYMIP